ncbi:WRKY1b transcription factor [Medicago truncatula]|uniref:WRKY1b transcription factor n=1 Tax=Medicago truncatula TaxID=3880 RepID=G7JVY1_MEDTR|nr:WRKY1b transcription factor [Medicago truncatula]
MDATHSTIPFQVSSNENQTFQISSHETRIEFDFFKDNNNDHHHVETQVDDHIHTDTPSLLELKMSIGPNPVTTNTSSDQSLMDDDMPPNLEDKKFKREMAIIQGKIERKKMENCRLKMMYDELRTDYNYMQMRFEKMMQDHNVKEVTGKEVFDGNFKEKKRTENGGVMGPMKFMDLGLASNKVKEVKGKEVFDGKFGDKKRMKNDGELVKRKYVDAGLDTNKVKEVFNGKCEKKKRTENGGELVQRQFLSKNEIVNVDNAEATLTKTRVTIRARSEETMITDGCEWRKFGQKLSKGNPCPKACYRCSTSRGCSIQKQVQRCALDRTVAITTYEENRNLPLPAAAKEMVQTTSAAAKMLLSASTSSNDGQLNANLLTRTPLPCSSSIATISASAPFPTITIDYTQSPNTPQRNPYQFQTPLITHSSANSSTSLIPQIPNQNQSKFSGLQMSNDAAGASQLLAIPNIVQIVNAAIAANPNFPADLLAALTSIIGYNRLNNIAADNHDDNHVTEGNNNGSNNNVAEDNRNGNITGSSNNDGKK